MTYLMKMQMNRPQHPLQFALQFVKIDLAAN
jgi:hypothetical protein